MARALNPDKTLQQCTVQSWRTRDGMPGVWVRSIVQSDEGYLWIATYGGVVRFDGERLTPLEAPGPLGRLFDTMMLKRGTDGALLIVPSTGGPACLDDAGLRDCGVPGTALPPGTRPVDVHRDADGATWLAARTALFHHRPGQAKPTSIALPWTGEFRLMFVNRDRRGRLWLGSTNGLLVGTPGKDTPAGGAPGALDFLQGPAGPITGSVNAMFESPSGHIWFAGNDGLLRLDPDGRSTVLGREQGWPQGRPWQVTEDRHGNVWVAHAAGLIRVQAGRVTVFDERDGLPDDDITAVFEDREGGLWVGSRGAGLLQFTDRTVEMGGGPPFLHDTRWIESVSEDPGGALWFGTRLGLLRWQGGVERLYTMQEGLPSNHVLSVLPAASGGVWVGTTEGLGRLRPEGASARFERFAGVDGRVEALLGGRDGSLLLTVNGRLAELPAGATAATAPRFFPVADDFALGYVRGMGRDGAGNLYLAGVSAVGRLDGDRIVDSGLTRELRTARAIHTDAKGRLWITTGGGLLRLDAGRAQLFGPAQGLVDRQLFQVQTDGRGHVWVGTSRGILRIAEQELDEVAAGRRPRVHPVSLDVSDRRRDLVSTNVRQPGSLRDRQGRLWFATEQGPAVIDPQRLPVNVRPPTVVIETAVIDGRRIRGGQDNQLPPGPGNLEFRFSAVTLLEPHKSLHRYMLEGFDRRWIEAGARRVAYYTNIPPGRYRFRVQGSNADGVWNERGDSLEFRLRPQFHRTIWFYGLLAGALAAAVTLLWRMRVRSLRREYLAAFGERTRVARELHDTLLQGMSAVGLQLRNVRRRLTSEAPGAARELEALEGTITSSLQETRRFLSDLREQPGAAADLGVALERLGGRLTAGQAARAVVSVEGAPVTLPHAATGDLFRIASEAITNAVKHAAATRIDVALRYGAGEVELTIRDDGRGFDPEAVPGAAEGHFGLIGMRERGERLGGYALESKTGVGTTVRATLRLANPQQNQRPAHNQGQR